MNVSVKNLPARTAYLLIAGIVTLCGLTYLVWPDWELVLVVAGIGAYCFAAYQLGKTRRD